MWLIRLFGRIRGWYHANDEIYLSDACQRQRAQTMLEFYAHGGYPSD